MEYVSMIHRCQGHSTSSMLVNHTERKNIFYSYYSNMNCDKSNMLVTTNVLGVFQDLSQVVGIGIHKN